MPQLKICGITDAAFAVEAAQRGVDYLGLIFAAGSPRHVTVEQAHQIVTAVRSGSPVGRGVLDAPQFVGVFVNHSAKEIMQIASCLGLNVIQLHGNYDAEAVAALKAAGYEVWQLYDPSGGPRSCPTVADAVLLDGRRGTQCGGTGLRADWSQVAVLKRAGRRVVLAGGLSAANVAAATATGADILDANSTLETAPGQKSIRLLDEFLASIPRGIMVK